MTEFLVVGRGLAAGCIMHQLYRHDLSFEVFGDSQLSRSSRVAAGIWNPIVFKRLTKSWMADELIPYLVNFYREAERRTGGRFVTERNILRVFSEKQEEQLWQKKSRNELDEYLDPAIYGIADAPAGTNIPGKFGKVLSAGNLDINVFLDATETLFRDHLHEEVFDHSLLEVSADKVRYRQHEARNIVFCEGWLVKDNPFFSWIPLKPAKGEVLTVQIPGLDIGSDILNRSSFLFQSRDEVFRTGATYEWNKLDEQATEEARQELVDKLKLHTGLEFDLLKHEAGVRPSSSDRRPVIGPHPLHQNVFIFNGLGTKGVMIAPYFSDKFVNFYLQKGGLMPEVAVRRFYHLYERQTQGQGNWQA